jgi:ketosteroid isomerase-like protein
MYRPYTSSAADASPFRDVASQLRDLTQDFVMAFNTGNYDQAAGLFSGDGVLMVPQYEAIFGPKPIEKLLRQMGEQGYGTLRMETIRVDHSGDMAMEIGRFSMVVHKSDGTLTPDIGKYVRVWRRLGAWLMTADCWSRTARLERAA